MRKRSAKQFSFEQKYVHRLMKIYTRTGDKGETSLVSGGRFSKSHYIFEILGTIDELNSTLGLLSDCKLKDVRKYTNEIQNDLFNLSANIASHKKIDLRAKVLDIETTIDKLDKKLPPLENFILSGGSKYAVYLHQCRAMCRKVERLLTKKRFDSYIPYFNRLSDMLFILARYTNMKLQYEDVKWIKK